MFNPMRNFTQKLTALAAVGWLSLTTALAGKQFVPKEYSYKNVGMSSQSTINIPMTDLFIYPDGMDATANLDEAGVKAEFEFTDENVVGLYKYEYYSFGKGATALPDAQRRICDRTGRCES